MTGPNRSRLQRWGALALGLGLVCVSASMAEGQGQGQGQGRTTRNGNTVVTGPAKIYDGDTLVITGTKIHLNGIDAPELDQKCYDSQHERYNCGERAKQTLIRLTADKQVSCEIIASNPVQGAMGVCRAGGQDVNEAMIRQGFAVMYGVPGRRYYGSLLEARRKSRGMWAGEFVLPIAWRRGLTVQRPTWSGAGPCLVKGSLDAEGKKRYYTPDDPDYRRTRVDTRKGERWFCSVQDAIDNGFTRAGKKCQIKGKVFEDGRKVYFLPEDDPYPYIDMQIQAGDRWFCSPGHAYKYKFRRCLIKGIVFPDGRKLFFTPEHKKYSDVTVRRARGDKWICTTQMGQRAGFKRAP